MERISVLMCTYNEKEEYLTLAINSILEQTYLDIEFIIVLDNPNNKEIERVVSEYACKDRRIVVVKNLQNNGLSRSLNIALEKATGKYIARMDADDISHANRLAEQLKYLKTTKCDLVAAYKNVIDESGNILIRGKVKEYSPHLIRRMLKYDNFISHPLWLTKREVYTRLNGYREIYACEDYDFLLRAVSRGYKIGLCNYVLLDYRINNYSISRTNSLKQLLTADYIRKHMNDLDSIDQNKIDVCVDKKITNSKEKKYQEALAYMRYAADAKNIISVLYIIRALFKSRFFLSNLKRIILLRIIRFSEGWRTKWFTRY